MKKVLITGAGGFVGSYLIKEFKESSDPEIVATFKSIFVSGRFDKLNDASETQPFEDIDDELE